MLELQTIESMKNMMMIQEEIFKQQVQELHRLYNVQKKLMQELENGRIKRRKAKTAQTDTNNSMLFSVWNQTAATETGHNFQAFITRDDPKELSGSCSGDGSRILPIKFDFQIPSESTSNIHLSEDQKDLKTIDGENDVEVELTLGIRHSTKEKRSKHDYGQSNQVQEIGSCSRKTNNVDEYGEPSSSINNSSSVCQENTRPHWLLQDLSLNKT